ncbi:MAG: hypothetical protein COS40_10195 [Deltaproteobacteria bacterium CG03_land_8_20_14_0_80_45_14]|nr:MAG: hypothetical protein COS40_10195 [Deltaproteobacteria bacterium CG03_land_8_20_14_0_80_45_14]
MQTLIGTKASLTKVSGKLFKTKLLWALIIFAAILELYVSYLWADNVSQPNGKIVFVSWDFQIMLLDMKSRHVSQLTKSGSNLWPRWSFDGKKIAFGSVRGDHKPEIYIMDAEGTNQRRVTFTKNGEATDPHWGVDKILYFRSIVRGVIQENSIDLVNGEIKVISSTGEVSGKTIKERLEQRKRIYQIFPSGDGKYQILYFRYGEKLELLELASGTKRELRAGPKGQPSWSKDSKRIDYVTGQIPDQVLMIFDVKENTYEEINLGRGPNTGCGGEPSWNANSSRIVYPCATPYAEKSDSRLYILDLETKKSSMLIKGGSPDWH